MKHVRLRSLIGAAALAVGLAAGAAPVAQAAPVADLGFTDGAPFLNYSNDELNAEFDAGSRLGMDRVRIVVNWSAIETAPGVFDWANTDRLVDIARAHGFSVLAVLAGTPLWAQGAIPNPFLPGVPPADPATFGNFAGVAAAHLGGRVDSYEIWNEPNLATFFTPVDASRYVSLLRAAYPAIHGADGNATVISAGLASTINGPLTVAPVTYLQQMYAAGAGGFMDAVALHPYTAPFTVENDPNGQWNQVDQAYGVMNANGDGGKKIWITEMGAATGVGPAAVPDDVQSAVIISSLDKAASLGYVGPVFIHSLRDSGTDATNPEANYGLLRQNFSQKPSFDAVGA